MSQFEQPQALDKVQPKVFTAPEPAIDDRQNYEMASKIYKAIAETAKLAVQIHDMEITNDAKQINGAAGVQKAEDNNGKTRHSTDEAGNPLSRPEDEAKHPKGTEQSPGPTAGKPQSGGDSPTHKDPRQSNEGHQTPPSDATNESGSHLHDGASNFSPPEKDTNRLKGEDFGAKIMAPTETANPQPGAVVKEPHGTVLYLGEIPQPAPLPQGVTVGK